MAHSTIQEHTLYRLAFQAYEADKYQDALHYFRTLTMIDPVMPKYWMGLGACHNMLMNHYEALKAYGVAAMIDESDPWSHLEAAKCLFKLDQCEEAHMALQSAEKLSTGEQQYSHVRAELALIKAKWDDKSPV